MAIIKLNTRSLSDDSVTTPKIADTVNLGRRNLIINGAMQVAQRGTSFNAPTDGQYTLDRISAFSNGAGVIDIEQSTVVPEGFQYSLKSTVDTVDTSLGGTDFGGLRYVVEGYDTSHIDFGKSSAKQITLSFYARSNVTGTYSVSFRNSAASRSYAVDYTIDAVDTWERKEITITADTSGTWVTDSGKGIDLRFCLWEGGYTTTPNSWNNGNFVGSNNTNTSWIATVGNTFYITGVQLEVGNTATPFEHRSYGEELQLCYRYFYRNRADGGGDHNNVGIGTVASNDYVFAIVDLPTTMRVSPSVSYSALSDLRWTSVFSGSSGTPDSWGIGYGHATKPTLAIQKNGAGSGFVGEARLVGFSGTTTGYIDFSSEL